MLYLLSYGSKIVTYIPMLYLISSTQYNIQSYIYSESCCYIAELTVSFKFNAAKKKIWNHGDILLVHMQMNDWILCQWIKVAPAINLYTEFMAMAGIGDLPCFDSYLDSH